MIRTVAVIARQDLRLVLSDRGAVLWLFLLPIVFATFFGLVMGGGSGPGDGRVALTVVDADRGPVSALLLDELGDARLELRMVEPDAKDTTPDKVRTLVLPAGLSDSVLGGQAVELLLERDPGSSAEAGLVAQARITAAIAAVLARLVQARAGVDVPSPLTAEELATLPPIPDLVLVESRFAGSATVTPGGFAQSIPGNAVMFVMLIALTYGAASIAGERSGGQLRRLATTPASHAEIVIGKIGGRAAVAAVQVTVFMAAAVAGSLVFGIEIGDHPTVTWLVLVVYGLSIAPLGVAFGARFTDPDRAASLGVVTTMLLAAFGGCWWPIEIVSPPLQALSFALPTGWAMRALHATISFGRGLDGVLLPLAILAGFGAVFGWIATRSLRLE